jgi:hypothetical protein
MTYVISSQFNLQYVTFCSSIPPASFSDTWITVAIRRVAQPRKELRNNENFNIPFSRTTPTDRQPLVAFPRLWESFPDQQIKIHMRPP